ncbi:MAG: AAA family ATPase [Planctomycetia bacterium]|nr:AAA family ATPase [Planctomycetia bacterium]
MATLVPHKYMPTEMSEQELEGTFAARQHTLDYLVAELRKQAAAKSPNSYLITGPRGAGKTTMVLMLCRRIGQDERLNRAWLPVRFPEEQLNVTSLRDLLVTALRILGEEQGVESAKAWHQRCEDEPDDEHSESLAISGLREVARSQNKRFIFFIENLDLLFDRGLDEQGKARLRRLLMSEPVLLIVGTAVRVFEEIQAYDRTFFGFFSEVPLDGLSDKQVQELLFKRADYDRNEEFKRRYPEERAKVRALTHLTGGNPRLLLMLYEMLSDQNVLPVVQALHRLIDELTPMLGDVLKGMPPQQTKVLDALMRAGGTATPTRISELSRLPLNAVTTQLGRLKEEQKVAVRGGGKGKPAYYTVPDPLFSTWYQMRYLRPNRRRIEFFVRVLRVWFEAEERFERLRALVDATEQLGSNARDAAAMAEYFAATLTGTRHSREARDLAVCCWLAVGDFREAAFALAEFARARTLDGRESHWLAKLAKWAETRGDSKTEVAALEAAVKAAPDDTELRCHLAFAFFHSHKHRAVVKQCNRILSLDRLPAYLSGAAHWLRGSSKQFLRDYNGAIEDFTLLIESPDTPDPFLADALFERGLCKGMVFDFAGATEDYSAMLALSDVPGRLVAAANVGLGLARTVQGAFAQGIENFLRAIHHPDAGANNRLTATSCGFQAAWVLIENRRLADSVLDAFRAATRHLPQEALAHECIALLGRVADADLRDAWPHAWRSLREGQPSEVAEALDIMLPVVQILEGADPSVLDPLPPEHRSAVMEMVQRFQVHVDVSEAQPTSMVAAGKRRKRLAPKREPSHSRKRSANRKTSAPAGRGASKREE